MKINNQLIKFFSGGLIAVSIDWSVYLLLASHFEVNHTLSKALSFIAGTVFAYFFNGLITFNSNLNFHKFVRHLLVYCISLLFNIVAFYFFSKWLSSENPSYKPAALLLATCVSMTTNFLGMRFWVFNKGVPLYG